jgi:hypothetical protein
MNRNAFIFSCLVLTLAALGGCSSAPPASDSKKAGIPLEKIQGKIDVIIDPPGTGDSALNSGGPSLYLWAGKHRYRLFTKKTMQLVHEKEYIVEGVNAQKAIDAIGDPSQGKNGYPLAASCERVVRMAWSNLPFDEFDVKTSVLRSKVARYPARTIFMVTRIQDVTANAKKGAEPEEPEVPTVAVPADKQRALLVEGSTAQTAPLWDPTAGTVRCKVIINPEGKISELETGAQLCEAVQWDQFKYKPTLKGGKPVNVRTEVEVQYQPRK